MKLSEIQGEKAIEVIAELIDPLTAIALDKNIKSLFEIKVKEGETAEEAAVKKIKAKVPFLLKEHKKEFAQIIGILEGKDPEKLNILEIVKGIMEMISDKALMQLFSFALLKEEAAPLTEGFSK